jgi:hypothetical protein
VVRGNPYHIQKILKGIEKNEKDYNNDFNSSNGG